MAVAPEPRSGAVSRVAAALEQIVFARIESDRMILPALPAVAAKCIALLRSKDFNLRDAATLIGRDPVLAAQVVKQSNNAAFATREPVKSVQDAVTRLGSQKLYSFLVGAAAHQVFESRDRRIANATMGLWEHSVAVALLTRQVVGITNSGDIETGYLAGLLHDVGKVVLAGLLLETERQAFTRAAAVWIDDSEWVAVVQLCHRKVGLALAKRWELPETVCKSIADAGDYDNGDRLSVANAVRFSNAVVKQLGIYVGDFDREDNEALVMIGRSLLGLEEDVVQRIAQGVRTQAQATS